jgi:hypothetical protein
LNLAKICYVTWKLIGSKICYIETISAKIQSTPEVFELVRYAIPEEGSVASQVYCEV